MKTTRQKARLVSVRYHLMDKLREIEQALDVQFVVMTGKDESKLQVKIDLQDED